MTEKPMPDIPSDAIPEVVPERHIAPETPPIAPPEAKALGGDIPQFIEPVARKLKPVSTPVKSTPAKKPTSQPIQKSGRKERYFLITFASSLRSLSITFAASVIVATIFMWWTSPSFLPSQVQAGLAPVQATARQEGATRTALPTPIWFNRIGVLAGHTGIATFGPTRGNPDPGTICPDGFFERDVTEKVSEQVVAMLRGRGFTVDLFEEFDLRLAGYQAAAFISLHADSCENFGYGGFKSTYPFARQPTRDTDRRLDECIRQNYSAVTGLEFRPDNITDNMRYYHAFDPAKREGINPNTPAAILELGFLSYDRNLLQNRTDVVATGIVNGLLCFLQPTTLATEVAKPIPATIPIVVPSPTPVLNPGTPKP